MHACMHVGDYGGEFTKTGLTCKLRARFNDVLNNSVAKIDQYIMTINSCNTFDHYDRFANLSPKGKRDFWIELDDLIDRFERDRVKLHPNPTPADQQRDYSSGTTHRRFNNGHHHLSFQNNYRLMTKADTYCHGKRSYQDSNFYP